MPGAGPDPDGGPASSAPCRTARRAVGDVPGPRYRVPLSHKRDGIKDVGSNGRDRSYASHSLAEQSHRQR